MICKKCGERQGQAAPQCVEVSSSGVRFVEHAWQGGSGRSLTSGRSRGDSMRALTENRPRARQQPQAPRAPQYPTIPGGPDMSEFFKLSGVSPRERTPYQQRPQPMTEQQPPRAPAHAPTHARGFNPNLPDYLQPNIPQEFLREDMPAHPSAPLHGNASQPAPVQAEYTGPLTHAEILRECAPLCRHAGPGLMGTDNPGRLVRGAPIVATYKG